MSYQLIVELAIIFKELTTGVVWPLSLVIISYFFKKELSSLIPRIREVSAMGANAKFDAEDEQKRTSNSAVKVGEIKSIEDLKKLPNWNDTAAISRLRVELHQNLNSVADENKVDVLVANLAVARLSSAFGRIYSAIYGSQISGLVELSSHKTCTLEEAKEYFKQFDQRYPEVYKNYGFDGWLGFLQRNSLVEIENGIVRITAFGEDFLLYLRAHGLHFNKAY